MNIVNYMSLIMKPNSSSYSKCLFLNSFILISFSLLFSFISFISLINNIFEDEKYAELPTQREGYQYCGYIYNQNYLCVSDRDNSLIRIWDLVNKNIYKQINYDGIGGYGIIPWNHAYTIVACETYFIVIDIEEGKMLKRILYEDEVKVKDIKKIKISNLGECLICSSEDNTIKLFNI